MAGTLKTSRNETFEMDFVHAPLINGGCMAQIRTDKPIGEIAPSFEGLEWIEVLDADMGTTVRHENYNRITNILEVDKRTIRIKLRRSEDTNAGD